MVVPRLGVKSGNKELVAVVLVQSRLTVAWTEVESVRMGRNGGQGLGVWRQSLQRWRVKSMQQDAE